MTMFFIEIEQQVLVNCNFGIQSDDSESVTQPVLDDDDLFIFGDVSFTNTWRSPPPVMAVVDCDRANAVTCRSASYIANEASPPKN